MWDALAPDLDLMGTTKVTDSVALAALCETYGRWRKVNELAAKTPPVFRRHRDGEDVFVKNPLYSQVRDATNELRIMLREFGLTPSARAGLHVDLTISNGVDRLFTTG